MFTVIFDPSYNRKSVENHILRIFIIELLLLQRFLTNPTHDVFIELKTSISFRSYELLILYHNRHTNNFIPLYV